jgi:hypothetical protein
MTFENIFLNCLMKVLLSGMVMAATGNWNLKLMRQEKLLKYGLSIMVKEVKCKSWSRQYRDRAIKFIVASIELT